MKIDDIKKAYDSVSANGELKEKVFSRFDYENEDISRTETSHIEIKRGGMFRITSFAAAAAMIAAVFVIGRVFFNLDDVVDPFDGTETTAELVDMPEALVTLRVVDENGVPVKNMRIDYLPVIITEKTEQNYAGCIIDINNLDKGGTVPITYGRDETLLIPYGDYCFNVSNAMPNAEYDMFSIEESNVICFVGETGGSSGHLVTVDEYTEEIVLTAYGGNHPYQFNYPKLGVILQDAQGEPLPDYTVILKPRDGIMQEGYSDKYGGYVLTRTNEEGEAFWRGDPISGEYEVIAYREELHTADAPILEPFVFDGDNSFSYVYKDTVFINHKTFKMAE